MDDYVFTHNVTDPHVKSLNDYGTCVVDDMSANVCTSPREVGTRNCLSYGDKKYICRLIAVQSTGTSRDGVRTTYLTYSLVDVR